MPRKSAASLGVVPLARVPVWRPDPPAELTEAEKVTWNDAVAGMNDGWFSKATLPMLRGYCLIVKQADEIAGELRGLPHDCERARVLRLEHTEVMRSMALIGTKLRVCPSSNKSTKDGQRRTNYPRPWEGFGDDGDAG
jgi:hypothetical protein